jgi:hypothetical protein
LCGGSHEAGSVEDEPQRHNPQKRRQGSRAQIPTPPRHPH